MTSDLLSTKVRIPPRPHHVVPRHQLIDALRDGIPLCKLTVVSAPAGFGKTTLLAEWAHASDLPVAWLTVTGDEEDPERFVRYLMLAWEQVHPGIRDCPVGVLLGAISPDIQAVLTAFVNVVSGSADHSAIVLDDAHLIDGSPVVDLLVFLLDNLPATVHLVVAGRGAPALPLARYRARRQLLELGAEDLRLSVDETSDFLRSVTGQALDRDSVALVQARLEGWAAGVQLAALMLQRQPHAASRLELTGRERFISDYLSDEVLAHLPDDVQRFLLQTSILDDLCAWLCDAVNDQDTSQEMLEALERGSLFLMPLDDSREWYRYHRAFAEFLRAELERRSPELVPVLHRRAAIWLLAHDLPDQAFRHAVDGDDIELAGHIAEQHFVVKLLGGEIAAVRRMLDSLPPHWLPAHPAFDLSRAAQLLLTGAFDDAIRRLDDIEQRLARDTSDMVQESVARATAIRCFVACFLNDLEQAEAYAARALRALPDDDPIFRPGIFGALGDTYRRNGFWREAQANYRRALDFTHSPAFHSEGAHVYGALADLSLRQGRLREAGDYWNKALATIQDHKSWGRIPLPVIGWVHVRMGELLYEWNDLTMAWNHLSSGLERAELGGDVRALIAGYVIAARLKLTEGNIEAAAGYLERARPSAETAAFPEWTSRFERVQLDLWLAQNRLRAAVSWADERLHDEGFLGRPENEPVRLALSHVLIVKGDRPARQRATVLLRELLDEARAAGMGEVEITALALQALAQWRSGDRSAGLTSLEHALWLAEPEGYVRRFADLGLPMARLLQEAHTRGIMREYVEVVLAAFGALPDERAAGRGALLDPLTSREVEILALLAAGSTNQEIAQQLVISPETVKKHTANIYTKLGVHRRTEAAARARELNLLG